jgi:RNA polymerase sigma-70 factor (ECF subfamily)
MAELRDPHAFERAYREHRAGALAAARGVLRDPDSAEEVVQDVFTHLWRRPRAFDERRGSLHGYITMLARSRAIDRWRTQAVQESAFERLGAGTAATAERSAAEHVIDRESASRAASMVDRLPPPQREALLLTFAKGMSSSEIAVAIGVPAGTVKSRVRLGLDKLRLTADGAT